MAIPRPHRNYEVETMEPAFNQKSFDKWVKSNSKVEYQPPSYSTPYEFHKLLDSLMHDCAGCGRRISKDYEKCRKCSYDNQSKPKVQ